MEIAYRIQPAGNVNLRAYVAGRKRAHNSSVRSWRMLARPACDPSEDVMRKKQCRDVFLLIEARGELRRFYSRSEYCWWSVKFNERIKITFGIYARIFIQRVCHFCPRLTMIACMKTRIIARWKWNTAMHEKKIFPGKNTLSCVFTNDFTVCYTLIGSSCDN